MCNACSINSHSITVGPGQSVFIKWLSRRIGPTVLTLYLGTSQKMLPFNNKKIRWWGRLFHLQHWQRSDSLDYPNPSPKKALCCINVLCHNMLMAFRDYSPYFIPSIVDKDLYHVQLVWNVGCLQGNSSPLDLSVCRWVHFICEYNTWANCSTLSKSWKSSLLVTLTAREMLKILSYSGFFFFFPEAQIPPLVYDSEMKQFSFWDIICLTEKKVCIDFVVQFLTPSYKSVSTEEMLLFLIFYSW